MLQRIEIRNFALIESMDLELGAKVNVFSGETGAGKSILLDALAFLLGARSNPGWIRNGKDRMNVAGSFKVSLGKRIKKIIHDQEFEGYDPDASSCTLHIWRELHLNGRSQVRVNGLPVTVTFLRSLGNELMELQGQQETLMLLQNRHHLAILDQYGDSAHQETLLHYTDSYDSWLNASRKLSLLAEEAREGNRLEDLWRFQVEEIEQATLRPQEEEPLIQRLQVLRNLERVVVSLNEIIGLLSGRDEEKAASSLIYLAKRELENISRLDDTLKPWTEMLDTIYWQIDELDRDLESYLDTLDADPGELERLEERLRVIRKLKSKYGDNISDVLAYCEDIQFKLDTLERHEEHLHALEEECRLLEVQLLNKGQLLSRSRAAMAERLQEAVMNNLSELMMSLCRFAISFKKTRDESVWQRSGLESCEFLIAPNPGEPLKPMVQIASGGELARILLALKSALVAIEMPDIMIFDEPDSGLSGTAVRAMASALKRLGESCQVLLVTHQAPVAAIAESHYLLSKETHDDQTYTHVELLNREGRLQEMVRLLASDESSLAARRHAEEMLEVKEAELF
ncbi:MAG: DNA repair protein RecN [Symbiobacteriaceae bacterium]|nr:DNA repair protein RecN [Symbiobacteriaceae bacterium]